MRSLLLLLFLYLHLNVVGCFDKSNKTEIYIGSIFPRYGDGWPGGYHSYFSMVIAFNEINNNSQILPNYQLKWVMNDSSCNALVAVESLYWQETNCLLTAVFGGGCSVESVPTALITATLHQPQISYGSTSPELSDKSLYPYFLRVVPSDIGTAQAWVGIVQYYGWKNIATLNSQENLFSLLIAEFLKNLKDATGGSITVVTSETFPGSQGADVTQQLLSIKKKGATVIFIGSYTEDSINIFTTAGALGMTGADYAWIGAETIDSTFISKIDLKLVQGLISTSPATGKGPDADLFYQKFQAFTGMTRDEADSYITYAYDAAYVLAHGLHKVLEVDKLPYDLQHPSSSLFGTHLYETLLNISFMGVSSDTPLMFDSKGDRLSSFEIRDIRDSSYYIVGIWDAETQSFKQTSDGPVVWADGTTNIPKDALQKHFFQLDKSLKNIALAFTILFMTTTVVFLCGVYHWKSHPRLKAASTLFLFIMLFAGLLSYSVVIIIYVEPVSDLTCILPHWFGHLGFLLMFGSLFAKTFRVWQIFNTAQRLKRKAVNLNDGRLLLFVGIFVMMGVFFLIIHTVLFPPLSRIRQDEAIATLLYLECYSPQNVVLLVLFIVEFLSLFFGVFLSFKTRKIELLKFNESSHISQSIYSILFMGFIFIPMGYFLEDKLNPNLSFLIAAGGIILGTTTSLAFLFTPKFFAIIMNKPDNQRRHTSTSRMSSFASGVDQQKKDSNVPSITGTTTPTTNTS